MKKKEIKIFISGSISIKKLPEEVKKSIDRIIEQKMEVLVGDAPGIDSLVQRYCEEKEYYNVLVYTIEAQPRNIASKKFKVMKTNYEEKKDGKRNEKVKTSKRERQMFKDRRMSKDSDYSLVVWDGKSQGSYNNIINALKDKKIAKVYYSPESKFLEKEKTEENNIEYIYREVVGYSSDEVVKHINDDITCQPFESVRDFNKYLIGNKMVKKNSNKIYLPEEEYEDYILVKKYKGKETGINFKNEFIELLQKKRKI